MKLWSVNASKWFHVALTVFGFSILPVDAAISQIKGSCPPDNIEDHNEGLYHFKTASRIEPYNQGVLKNTLKACVSNEKTRAIFVWWLIPNMRTYIPGTKALDAVGLPFAGSETDLIKSCILYGDRGDTDRVSLLVPQKSVSKLMASEKGQCSKIFAELASATPDEIPVQNMSQTLVSFFPSTKKEADATMLELDADVGILYKGRQSPAGVAIAREFYVSYVHYSMTPYNDSKGDPSSITFEPAFTGDAQALTENVTKEYGKVIKGSRKGRIDFGASIEEGVSRLVYTSYNVRDDQGDIVATVPIPVFLPLK